MGTLGIHPAQISWLEALARGDKVVWHREMHILACFGKDFPANREQYVAHPVTPDHFHDLLYPMDKREGLAGVQFWCLGGILQYTDLLNTQDASGGLSPLAVYEHGVRWYENRVEYAMLSEERRAEMRKRDLLATTFLKDYTYTIPSELWMQALPRKE